MITILTLAVVVIGLIGPWVGCLLLNELWRRAG
jgi:hypothetical protein